MPRAIVFHTVRNQPKTGIIMGAVAHGLRCAGYEVEDRESTQSPRGDEQKVDLLAVWGDTHRAPEILADAVRRGRRCLQVDNAYLNRNRYEGHYGLSYGARQCYQYLWDCPRYPVRFAALNETISPWRTSGDTILILAPSIKQGRFLGFDSNWWAGHQKDFISCYTKKKIRTQIKTYTVNKPLRDTLRDESIFACIGYNTKGLVDCLLYGIPVFNLGPCVTERMGCQDLWKIDTPYYPENRQEFFERLAGHQWLLSEITEGLPFQPGVMPI